MNKYIFIFIISISLCININSQNLITGYSFDSYRLNYSYSQKNDSIHSPKKAALYSSLLPGLGQGYNKKYWKIPIIYAGLGGSAYAFFYNRKYYVDYRDAIEMRLDDDPNTIDPYIDKYSLEQLSYYKDFYQRNIEISAIVFVCVYLLNILDAIVDAHLFDFSINTKLSYLPVYNNTFIIPTVSINYNFFKKNKNDKISYNRIW